FAYDDGEVRQEFSVCVACRLLDGSLSVSDESVEVTWIPADRIERIEMHPRIRARIHDYLADKQAVLA
ncbi:MAG: NUDIX hydrolase, partial [Stackebrandtia sp.]